jgi:hypothetical protein
MLIQFFLSYANFRGGGFSFFLAGFFFALGGGGGGIQAFAFFFDLEGGGGLMLGSLRVGGDCGPMLDPSMHVVTADPC